MNTYRSFQRTTRPDRTAQYDEARAFFDGDQWATLRQPGERRVTFNYARALTRKAVSYCYPEPVTFELPPPIDAPARDTSDVERAFNQLLQTIGCPEQDPQLMLESSYLGDAAVKITFDPATQLPVVASVDPAALTADYDPSRPDDAIRMVHRYSIPAWQLPTMGVPTPSGDPERRVDVSETWTAAEYTITVDEQTVTQEANPYGWMPYLTIANERQPREFWGTSDLVDLYPICRELNRRISVISHILELSGAPIVVLENVDSSDGIALRPGAKWELPEDSKAYLLDLLQHGGVRLHIETIDLLFKTLFDIAETPRTAFGDSGRALSGAALEVEIQPLVQRVRRKRQLMTGYYRRRNRRILDLLERFTTLPINGLRETTPNWPSILPTDDTTETTNTVSLVASDVLSRKSAATRLQLSDPDAELAQILAERRALRSADAPESPESGEGQP